MSALEELAKAVASAEDLRPSSEEESSEEEEETSSPGSDTDSWTLLDDEEEVAEVKEPEEEEAKTTKAPPTFSEMSTSTGTLSGDQPEEDDDDESVKVLARDPAPATNQGGFTYHSILSSISLLSTTSAGEHGPESLPNSVVSDGIPIAEDLSEEKPQYLWNDDFHGEEGVEQGEDAIDALLREDRGTDPRTPEVQSEQEEDDDDDTVAESEPLFPEDNDMEVIDQQEIESIPHRPNDLTTVYPGEELPSGYAEIKRGQTYNHHRNQTVNLALSTLLVLVMALVLGLGVGHFKGWRERLELQELYAEVREEKMEDLTVNLVNCMTGPEAEGGDDQDLDDRVIQHLFDENNQLKEELDLIKKLQEDDDKVEEEMSVILRDRINDLVAENSKLFQEVTQLKKMETQAPNNPTEDSPRLINQVQGDEKVKNALNEIMEENAQLRIALGKARYSPPIVPLGEKVKINLLQTENNELKQAVRQYRYAPVNLMENSAGCKKRVGKKYPDLDLVYDIDEDPFMGSDDFEWVEEDDPTCSEEGSQGVSEEERDNINSLVGEEETSIYNQVELRFDNRFKPNENDVYNYTKLVDISINVPELIEMEEEEETPEQDEEKTSVLEIKSSPLFAQFKSVFQTTAEETFQQSTFDPKRGLKVLDKLDQTLVLYRAHVLNGEIENQLIDLEIELLVKYDFLGEFVSTDAASRHPADTQNALARLGKAFISAAKTLTRGLDRDVIKFTTVTNNEVTKTKKEFLQKWNKVLDKYQHIVDRKDSAAFLDNLKQKQDGDVLEHLIDVLEQKEETKEILPIKEDEVTHVPSKNATNAWVFNRAQQRKHSRHQERRSDWMFERANVRKKLQDFNSADWNMKKALQKDCYVDETNGELKCEDLSHINVAGTNHGHSKIKKDKKNKNKNKKHKRGDDGQNFEDLTKRLKRRQQNLRKVLTQLHDFDSNDFEDNLSRQRREEVHHRRNQHQRFHDLDDDDDDDDDDDEEEIDEDGYVYYYDKKLKQRMRKFIEYWPKKGMRLEDHYNYEL